ncbi:8-hydroxyquercetin 8-O-methyltransferase [Sesamum alatum]|uniref:8-hydroxyquercetin 8-O-methyltransferase n=1 Tax=Sesamum alatum TaxID=300844 RepID=A0AAE1YY26_9LAMI|nr:8-hydroxyquercetin 8-O-methyltransferase [Sesamum alatum]
MGLPNGEQSSHELLDAQSHVWNYIFKFINSILLKCATELGIPDTIHKHGKPMTLAKLINALPINKAKSHYFYHLMRILVHSEFFVKVNISDDDEQNEGYWLTPTSRLLLRDEPLSIKPFVQVVMDPILVKPWAYMSEWLADDHHLMAFETAHGTTFWKHAERVPRLSQLFNEAMACDSELVNRVILNNSKQVFEGFKSLVDVGGGTGATAKAVAAAFPGMRCIVLDLPHVVAGSEGTKNLTYVGGDMFEAVPHADVVLLKWILHDWNDEDCVKILKKCKDAIGSSKDKGGKLVVIDIVVNRDGGDKKAMEDQLFYDMAMMVYLNGRERTEEEWAKLFSDAGFNGYKIAFELGVRVTVTTPDLVGPARTPHRTLHGRTRSLATYLAYTPTTHPSLSLVNSGNLAKGLKNLDLSILRLYGIN